MTDVTPVRAEIERDRWGRPLVVPPTGGKPVPYTRATTFVGAVEDTYNLSKWQQRMVALGLADRPDLLLSVGAHRDDKAALNRICEDAQEAAKAHAAATTGTALHLLTERMDRGLDVGVVPEAYVADLAAYATATQDLEAVHIEAFCVQDWLKVGGTPDRVVRYKGQRYIADLKTGSIEHGYLKIAAQLAMYARSNLYDVASRERSRHEADTQRGIIIHLPAGTGTCTLYWIDLLEGWEVVKVARAVREKRSLSFSKLLTGLGAVEPPAPVAPPLDPIAAAIAAAATEDAVRALWSVHATQWREQHTELAKARIAALASTPTK